MNHSDRRDFSLPLEDELGLHRLSNASGLEISVLPNGCVFAIEHAAGDERTMISQVFGSPLGSGIGRVWLRIGGTPVEIAGPGADAQIGFAADRCVWEGKAAGISHRVTLWLAPDAPLWLWRVELANQGGPIECDVVLVQDIGLAARGLVLANEAYASQYIDHHIAADPQFGPVIMSRQNMAQYGRNPWAAHGCVDGAAGFATDASQLFGPAFRSGLGMPGSRGDLPGKLQGEAACAAIQSRPVTLAPGGRTALSFFGLFEAHHPDATGDADLARLDAARAAAETFGDRGVSLSNPPRSVLETALYLAGEPVSEAEIARAYPERLHEERQDGALLSFFTPDGAQNRHVALAEKERLMRRRHGAILRSGESMLLDEQTLSATCWMHGVFAAQLTIGNTALHKLFSVSRDPYNITQASGLRILADWGDGWRLLTVPSVFEMGLNDCRWVYHYPDGVITVHALTSAEDTAMAWTIETSGKPCRFLVFGHLVMGEHEYRHPASVEIDEKAKRLSIRPGKDWIWGGKYGQAVHHLVTATPDAVEAMGSGALLFEGDAAPRSADAWLAIRTKPTQRFAFALVGALDDPAHAETLAAKYAEGVDIGTSLDKSRTFWSHVTRDTRFPDDPALDAIFPWFVHDAMIHLTVPRGLEQYSAAAWGTRDVCQGPVELLLPLGHHEPVAEILRIVFAQQYEKAGDWPQWFMLDPYGQIRDRHSHGDVIVWPLKALCDYLEATGDLGFLSQQVAWTADDFTKTARKDSIAAHVEKLLAVVRERFIPGTHLIRYGLGDWNDALQPADPEMRDWMVSSWTVALLYQQIIRYAAIMKHAHEASQAASLLELAAHMREDFNRHLMPDGTIAGYTLFHQGREPEFLLHPRDHRTGVRYSLIPMTRSMIAGLFTPEQAEHHLDIIRAHLLCPDGARLMDRPVTYSGGLEINFRRAESASFFGREIGLMYSHSHLRYCEALGVLGDREAARAALRVINPIAVTQDLANATLRQRNAYFSSSDAAFRDRAEASAEWARVRAGTVPVDGGWRVYSSGAGIFTRLALRFANHASEETAPSV
jgi:cellobiose phosphorylase